MRDHVNEETGSYVMQDSCQNGYSDWAFISSGALKMIAAVSMIIDHIGFALFPKMICLRIIGRISFPIYCFLLAESARYTRDIHKFLLRLGIFALISELPFNLAFWRVPFYGRHQNVYFTLFLGVAMIAMWQKHLPALPGQTGELMVLAGACAAASLMRTDYMWNGIMVIAAFYYFHDNQLLKCILAGAALCCMGNIEPYAAAAFIPIALYNGKQTLRGRCVRNAFYALYPVHLAILWICWLIMHRVL